MEYQRNEINFLISVAWVEREHLRRTSLSLALDHPRLYRLLPTLEKLKNKFRWGKDKVTVLVEIYRFYFIKLPFFVGPKLPFILG